MITIQSQDKLLKVYPEGNRFPCYREAIYSTLDEELFTHPVARDLIRIGQAIFTADRTIRRQMYFGGQTRNIHVEILLENPALFKYAQKELIQFACFCTRDNWSFDFGLIDVKKTTKLKLSAKHTGRFDCIALFSDGLDSLCGAARLIEFGANPVFVSHFQPRWGLTTAKRRLHEIASIVGGLEDNFESISIRYDLSDKGKTQRHNYFPETSRRSRPCLYLCFAAAVAVEYGIAKILLHENGILAMNLPFSKSHIGAQISRHAHPMTLFRLATFLSEIWPHKSGSPVVENPFFNLTKADQVTQFCKNLPAELVEATVSCENASRTLLSYKGFLREQNKRARTDFMQCGVCTPCLIRRQAMMANGFEEKHNYAFSWKKARSKKELPKAFNNDNFQILEQYCKEIIGKSRIDFVHRYFTELSLLSECSGDLTADISGIYTLQKHFARQYLKTIKDL